MSVADQDRAKDFYCDVLGFELVSDNTMGPDQRRVQVCPPGAETSPGSLKGLVVETDDLDADVKALTARGLAIEGGIQDAPWGRYVTFADPDGNGIVLQATAGD